MTRCALTAGVRSIDFNDLPRTTRERFVRSLVSASPAARPICQRVSKQRSPAGWYLLLVLAAAALGGLGCWRFGAIDAPVQDRRLLGGYVAAGAALVLSASMLARRRAIRGSLPFAPGVYVFPLDLVDARTRQLELYSLSELQSLDPVHHSHKGRYTHSSLWLVFPTRSFVFEARGQYTVDAQLAAVRRAREALAAATHRGTLDDLASLDPFIDARAQLRAGERPRAARARPPRVDALRLGDRARRRARARVRGVAPAELAERRAGVLAAPRSPRRRADGDVRRRRRPPRARPGGDAPGVLRSAGGGERRPAVTAGARAQASFFFR